MGYFCLAKSKSKRDLVQAIASNAQLWLDSSTDEHDYLIETFVQKYVDDYKKIVNDGKSI